MEVLLRVGHEEVALSGEDVGVADDDLGGDRKEEVVLKEGADGQRAPALGVAAQEAQGLVVAEVEGQALRGDLGVVAVQGDLDRHPSWLAVDQVVQSSH